MSRSGLTSMPFSPAPLFEDQQQPPPQQQPTINAITINSGEALVTTTLAIVPFSPTPPLTSVPADTSKKRRGRPRGSRNKIQSKKRASGSVRPVTAHIMMVNVQENVLEKIMAFSQNLSRNISILSAVGTTSKATICADGKTVTYEGRFEIISLGGSLILDKKENRWKVFGGLNVSLSSDGSVFGGQLVDVLIAASPVQIVLGSYFAGSQEEVESNSKEPPKEDSIPPSTESQEKVESDPKEPPTEDPSPPSHATLSNSSSDGLNVLV